MSFVHLHLHSEYSLLDGACRVKAIPAYALAMGMDACAITDHGVMYGAVEFYNACKAVGVKPIIGCELYVAPASRFDREMQNGNSYNHLVLLCKSKTGYKNLIYMVSKSNTEGFYQKPRIDMELLRNHHEGLICLTGCIAGKIPQLILNNELTQAYSYARELKELFGEDLYLEIQDHGLEEEKRVNEELIRLSAELSIELVATNDVHYMKKKDSALQNLLVCMQTNNLLTDKNPLGFESDEYYFKNEAKMREVFSYCRSAVDNTAVIADKCNFEFEFGKYYFPKISFDDKMSSAQYLEKLVMKGFEDKVKQGEISFKNNSREKYTERIKYELETIISMGYAEYFLIVADFVNYARTNKIPTGPGRGSGAGSLVAYLINITEVDSLEYNLLFEAFLNPERVSMPDFDIDFCYFKREQVIDYVKQKYGTDRVSQIITFGTLAPKAAIRSVGRTLGMSYAEVDEIVKKVPKALKITMDDVLRQPDIKVMYNSSEKIRQLLNFARQVEGMPKNISTHAAGVVISDRPLYEYVPLAISGEDILTQYNMNDIASLGLLKFDFLGIRYLTVIDDTEKMIKEKYPSFDIKEIPLDDKLTYELLTRGNTDGVFQLESAGMKQMLAKYKPGNIRDIMSAIALYRPGPAKFIDKYIENKQNAAKIEYTLPALAPILEETFGCIVYQEQVMEIFRAIAGYSYGKADVVRRAISKKKAEVIVSERNNFIDGAVALGADAEDAEALFEDMTGFANYGFKKSHAAAYAFISYRTAYLKTHYPAYYISALLTSLLGDMQKSAEYVANAKKMGINILPPDINSSGVYYTATDDGNIYYGLLALKNVGEPFINNIIEERKNGDFVSFEDFIERMADKDMNKRQVESLIKCGAFDKFGINRRALLQVYEGFIDLVLEKKRNNLSGQLDFFSVGNDRFIVDYPDVEDFTPEQKQMIEREVSNLRFSGNILGSYTDAVKSLPHRDIITILTDEKTDENTVVYICGIVNSVKIKNTRAGNTVAFAELEDDTAAIELVVFNDIFEMHRTLFAEPMPLYIGGRISRSEEEYPKLVVKSVSPISKALVSHEVVSSSAKLQNFEKQKEETSVLKTLYIRVSSIDSVLYKRALAIVEIFSGGTPVVFYDMSQKKYFKMDKRGVGATEFVIKELGELLGSENVVLKG